MYIFNYTILVYLFHWPVKVDCIHNGNSVIKLWILIFSVYNFSLVGLGGHVFKGRFSQGGFKSYAA